MPGKSGQADEVRALETDGEVGGATLSPCMPGMQMAVVGDLQGRAAHSSPQAQLEFPRSQPGLGSRPQAGGDSRG